MSLREEMEATGNWLFRWRSYLPLALIGLLLAGLQATPQRDLEMHRAWTLFCFAVSLLGLGVRVLTVGFTPKGTSGRNTHCQKALELNTSGVYSIVRNPLYLGNFLIWLGFALYCQLWWQVVIFVLVFWLYYERIIFAEEEFLRRTFGEPFESWAARTPAFVPRFKQWTQAGLPFSIRNVLKREYSGLFGVVVIFGALELRQHWMVEGRLMLDPVWQVIVVLGLVTYFALRTLKRHTRLLRVEGR
jgi:protein-S-isoprenylcysteine O-methyltransferase Ste14